MGALEPQETTIAHRRLLILIVHLDEGAFKGTVHLKMKILSLKEQ